MKQFVGMCLICLLLVAAVVVGIINGWIDLRGRPFQSVRKLQPEVEQRNQQIRELAEDAPD